MPSSAIFPFCVSNYAAEFINFQRYLKRNSFFLSLSLSGQERKRKENVEEEKKDVEKEKKRGEEALSVIERKFCRNKRAVLLSPHPLFRPLSLFSY